MIQENIRKSKEEQFQATFLHELFVNILGYTLNPNPYYNFTTEFKNERNNRKADGAILKDGSATGVIELKGTNTKDLESIRRQAFDYKANQKGCVYVVTSNFEKLRFYINDATEFEEFNLFELTPNRFALLYLCLQRENLLRDLPLKIKEASIAEEEAITKNFYKDYSVFKRELFRDLVKRNVKRIKTNRQAQLEAVDTVELSEEERTERNRLDKNVKLTLFKKSQKLIDRYLFIFFSEDRGLLPPNSTLKILNDFEQLKAMDAHVPLYDRFKLYFNYLDQGRKGTEKHAEIYAYNGGLFKPDAILDQLIIDDDLLLTHTRKLANYDFESQVDVNILGHIFENSLNEIESVNAEIEGDTFDKQTSKRKKDGVFYTPKYITKYIVENTVGKLCEEKKTELGFEEAEYFKSRKGRNKDTLKNLVDILDTYRDWLLQITICDPACGSGAFLNQALDFLIKEHRYIDELKAKVLGGGLVFADIENTILENNIYGVDLNEESVEIAKLSLWLRTAQPRRKLNDLSSNIKCGNSLIDSKAVAGDKAFKWEQEFPHIFNTVTSSDAPGSASYRETDVTSSDAPESASYREGKGGFDVVIGNPPYTYRNAISDYEKEYFKRIYKSAEGNYDLYKFFIEKTIILTKNGGMSSFIVPNTFLSAKTYKKLRTTMLNSFQILEFFDLGLDVFENVVVESVIYAVRKLSPTKQNDVLVKIQRNRKIPFDDLEFEYSINLDKYAGPDKSFNINISNNYASIIDKMKINSIQLGKICYCTVGINTGYIKSELTSENKIDKRYHKMLNGKDISRYGVHWPGEYIMFDVDFVKSKGKLGRALPPEYIFEKEKILIQRTRRGMKRKLVCYLDKNGFYNLNRLSNIVLTDENYNLNNLYLLLNSSLMDFYFNIYFNEYEVKPLHLSRLPIPVSIKSSKYFIDLSASISNFYDELNKLIIKYQTFFASQYKLEKLSRKLEDWYELDFGEFIKELNKSIKANNKIREKAAKTTDFSPVLVDLLTKKEEFEWMSLFEENKKKAQNLQIQIDKTEREIDQMVYELYGLTEEEIAIVENS
ncbi:Eco57I restriction-modification methylase domain-containing protein [Flavimarina sp. Hel_I_48]|uniref:Eco57I restriction-modification methylase domain-containing protein n=1 Tax=Flavimarina sp. Hel_I_48 TaxID=1392488 RepID=UPI00068B6F32|nr:TaqI-like C-terminal specificity domain-containing protein [Flavimarina sp. Hel_I_48]